MTASGEGRTVFTMDDEQRGLLSASRGWVG